MWKHLKHPNILPLLGVTIDPFQLISHWMFGGDLSDYVKKPGGDWLRLVGALSVILIPHLLLVPAI